MAENLEQRLERSEQLLEANEENKEKVERARQRLQQAQGNVNASVQQLQYCKAQLDQAIAARAAAQQRAAQDEDGGSVPASYDAAVASARAACERANGQLQEAHREMLRSQTELENLESQQQATARDLMRAANALQLISQKYGLQMRKTAQLMNTPKGHLVSPLMQQLGVGQSTVNDLCRRISESLGIGIAVSDDMGGAAGGEDSYGIRARVRSLTGSNTIYSGSTAGSGAANTYSAANGGGTASGYQSAYVKTTYSGPVTYRDPQTKQQVTKMSNRTVYENRNLDPNMVVPAGTRYGNGSKVTQNTTNLELMRAGKAPFISHTYPDGTTALVPVELHHLSGEETWHGSKYFLGTDNDGSLVEISSATHDRYNRQLHLGGPSFRRGKRKEKTADGAKYDAFRKTYWKNRAAKYDAS